MPASNTTPIVHIPQPQKPAITHVNMQLDSFLANSNIDDLRAIVRNLLATGPPGTTTAFTRIARNRVQNTATRRLPSPDAYFKPDPASPAYSLPTQALFDTIAKARALFGVGLGFQAIPILVTIVTTAAGHKFEQDGDLEDALISVDADLAQCLQSCREQLTAGDVQDRVAAKQALDDLSKALESCRVAVEAWGGEFPLEKGVLALEGWKL